MPTISYLLRQAANEQASDLHLSPGEPPLLRVHGDLVRTSNDVLDAEAVASLVAEVTTDAQRRHLEKEHELDFACELSGVGRYRVNAFVHSRGPGAVLRRIPTETPALDQMMLPPVLTELCTRDRGLVLVTGPTGSGKSTTLAAMVNHINETWDGHILTIEDPIEFVHRPKRSLVTQREVGPHTHSFANALKSALREDPDVILVGEMRDLETIALAITAAETGHLVFGTLHTSSAAKTIDRIIDAFPAGQQAQIRAMLSESLEAVIAQTLVKRKGGGRIAACEILVGIPSVRNLIREGKMHQIPSMMQTGGRTGMQTIESAYRDLVTKGLIERDQVPAAVMTAMTGTAGAAAR